MLWYIPGQGYVSDAGEDVHIPIYEEGYGTSWGVQGTRQVPWYDLPYQYNSETYGTRFQWEPGMAGQTPAGYDVHPGYVPTLLDWAAASEAGTLGPVEQPQWEELRQQALAVPLRDVSQAYWGYGPSEEDPEGLRLLNAMSPDVGRFLLETRDRRRQGTATAHELALARQIEQQARDWNWRATVPQASDANPFGMGDQFMQALQMLTLAVGGAGSFGAFTPVAAAGTAGSAATAAAPSVLGVPASTLSGVSTISGLGSMGTGMLGAALDEPWLGQAARVLSAIGGVSGLTGAAASGVTSWQDALRLAQKAYSTSNQVRGVTQAFANAPDQEGLPRGANDPHILYSMDPAARRPYDFVSQRGGSLSQAQTAAGSSGGSGGSSMAAPYQGDPRDPSTLLSNMSATSQGDAGNPLAFLSNLDWNQLGPVVAGLFGLAGTGMSLADIARYQGQQADVYGQQQGIKALLDAAYLAAKERYDTYYAQTQEQQRQEQEAYQRERERSDVYYGQTQQEQAQRQQAYGEQRQQIAEDRARAIGAWGEDRANVYGSFDERLARARQEYDMQVQAHQRRLAETDAERAMGMRGWEAAYGIGANLSDPTQIKEGAQAIYRPLSDLAVQRISDEVGVDRSLRGLSGPGKYGDYLAAKAYAPFENQLWETALNTYLTGQRGALDAYANRDLQDSPTPDFTDLPQFQYGQVPDFARQAPGQVPQTVQYRGEFAPPAATQYGRAPQPSTWTPTPYAPFGTTAQTGGGGGGGVLGGVGGAASGLSGLIGSLTKLLGLGGGNAVTDAQAASTLARLRSIYGDGTGDFPTMDGGPVWEQYDFGLGFGGQLPAGWDNDTLALYSDLGNLDLSMPNIPLDYSLF